LSGNFNITDFSTVFNRQLVPGQGMLLLAEPFLESPEFRRTVVLLTEHDDNGSMGFILNRKLSIKPNKAIKEFPDFDDVLYYGGPVNTDLLFYIHTLGSQIEGGVEIIDGVFLGGDFEAIKNLIILKKIEPGQIRFFAGYSGWAPGQLNIELKQNSWLVAPPKQEIILHQSEPNLWKFILKTMGGKYALMADFPEDPNLN
jgi:putative transcriptional regulator